MYSIDANWNGHPAVMPGVVLDQGDLPVTRGTQIRVAK
jgi:hypothetical protein